MVHDNASLRVAEAIQEASEAIGAEAQLHNIDARNRPLRDFHLEFLGRQL